MTHVFSRYYINHVTKTNTWTKPTLPAHGAGMASGNSRPPIPVATQSAPTVPRSGHIQSQHPHAQPSFGNPANQRGTLPYQPRQPQAQAAAMQARSAVLNPRPISQQVSTATSVQPHGGQYPRQSHVAGSTSSVSALPLNQAASPQNPINPLQQQGTTLNRPTASTVGPAQSAQQNQVTTPQAARPTLQNRIFSAPATTNAMNAASNMGTKFKDSMTALAQNPNAQQIALSLGTTAIQAALTDGDSSTQASNIVILPANTPYNNPPPANQSPNPPPNQPPPAYSPYAPNPQPSYPQTQTQPLPSPPAAPPASNQPTFSSPPPNPNQDNLNPAQPTAQAYMSPPPQQPTPYSAEPLPITTYTTNPDSNPSAQYMDTTYPTTSSFVPPPQNPAYEPVIMPPQPTDQTAMYNIQSEPQTVYVPQETTAPAADSSSSAAFLTGVSSLWGMALGQTAAANEYQNQNQYQDLAAANDNLALQEQAAAQEQAALLDAEAAQNALGLI